MNKALVWFRNDLRVEDNAALYHACEEHAAIGVFIEATQQRKLHSESTAKIGFTYDTLLVLKDDLKQLNIPLIIVSVESYAEIPDKLIELAQQFEANSIWFNREYLFNEIQRDQAVVKAASKASLNTYQYDCDLALTPNGVRKPDGSAYKVFTPYKKAWIKSHQVAKTSSYPVPKAQNHQSALSDYPCDNFSQDYRSDLWKAGSGAAKEKLTAFLLKAETYKVQRDIPSKAGTSLLSPYLAVGAISVKQCMEALYDYYFANDEAFYADTWLSELIWREFYRQIVIDNPLIVKHKPFKPQSREPWVNDLALFEAWKAGKTGFPIVDAAMRQLNQTGWMHNRLRMNVAMFLCKLCRIDWRWGEKYFMQTLIDGDFASNNGGWQWCSSSGADAAPYFRIMNPSTQSKRFDPDGIFVKRFVPELQSLDNKSIHDPSETQREKLGYCQPIIDYKIARQTTIELMA